MLTLLTVAASGRPCAGWQVTDARAPRSTSRNTNAQYKFTVRQQLEIFGYWLGFRHLERLCTAREVTFTFHQLLGGYMAHAACMQQVGGFSEAILARNYHAERLMDGTCVRVIGSFYSVHPG